MPVSQQSSGTSLHQSAELLSLSRREVPSARGREASWSAPVLWLIL
jgi:hypothetical protein